MYCNRLINKYEITIWESRAGKRINTHLFMKLESITALFSHPTLNVESDKAVPLTSI